MDGKLFPAFMFVGLLAAPALAFSPARLSPILPEVTKNLDEAERDVVSKTLPMARAHAQLVLLEPTIPFTVLFQGVPSSRHKQCLDCLNAAMREWEKDLNGAVKFQQASDTTQTNVVVRFEPAVTMGKEQVAGYVNWSRSLKTEADGDITPIFKADLQLRVKDLEGHNMPAVALRHAAMHELGHVLGLDDSPREGDVMGPLDIENPVSAPTSMEVETVKSFRGRASEILKEAMVGMETSNPSATIVSNN